jgi:hypothetical protein
LLVIQGAVEINQARRRVVILRAAKDLEHGVLQ